MISELKPIEFKIDPEFSTLIRKMSSQEYENLKNSIKQTEQHEDITVGPDGTVYEGHHRYQICTELKLPVKYKIREFKNRTEIIRFIIDVNDKRRHIQEYERGELLFKSDELEQEQAKAKQRQLELAGTRPNNNNNNNTLGQICPKVDNNDINESSKEKGQAIERLAKKHGFKPTQLKKIKKVMEKAPEEQKKKLREGKTTVHKVWNIIHREETLQNLHNNAQKYKLPDKCQIYNDDFREKLKTIQDNSIRLIFTDPPYGEQSLYLYEGLAKNADEVLNDGDSLVFYVGHIILNEVIKIFSKFPNLKFWWIFAVEHSGSSATVHARKVFVRWKPMLWYVKGQKPLNIFENIPDLIKSEKPDKTTHLWAQSEIEADHIIRYLTVENQTVFDPMMGDGNTGIATLKLNRKFIGIEKNPETFENARVRISKMGIIDK